MMTSDNTHVTPDLPPGSEKQIRVLAAVIRRGDDVLLCQRPAHKRHGGLWEFPGGKLEPGETLLEAARRELEEELGIQATAVGRTLYVCADPGSQFVIEFVEVFAEGEPVPTEHSAVEWRAAEAGAQLPLAPADAQFMEVLRSATP